MAGFLRDNSRLIYNGLRFPPTINARIQGVPVRSTDGRTNKYTRYILTVEFVLHNDMHSDDMEWNPSQDTVDDNISRIRRLLMQANANLQFSDKGFGGSDNLPTGSNGLYINTQESDVAYGPFPVIFQWQPIAANNAISVTWGVEVAIRECYTPNSSSLSDPNDPVIDLTYGISWDIDQSGLSTRSINGQLEIAARTVGNGGAISNVVDTYRDRFSADVPLGFERIAQNWTIQPDKRIATFTIVDREHPSDNPLFPGTVNPNVTVSVNNQNKSFNLWDVHINGSISVASGVPRWYAWAAFVIIVKSRMDSVAKGRTSGGQPGKVVIINHFSYDEQIYGRTTSFSMSYTQTCRILDVFKSTGAWAPIKNIQVASSPQHDWTAHKNMMTTITRAWSNRGTAGMGIAVGDDQVINACNTGARRLLVNNKAFRLNANNQNDFFSFIGCPDAKSSWLAFVIDYELVVKTGTTQDFVAAPAPSDFFSFIGTLSPLTTTKKVPGIPTIRKPAVQEYRERQYILRVRGYAMRAHFKIPEIHIKTFGGKKATEIDPSRQVDKVLKRANCDIHLSQWERTYSLEGKPDGDLATGLPINEKAFNHEA